MTNAYTFTIKNPADGQDLLIRFEFAAIEHYVIYNKTKLNNIETAKKVLINPKRIFVGINRPVRNDGMCFVGQPETWYIREDRKVPFPKEKFVFSVYLNSRLSVYDFRAEEIDSEDPLSPKDWKNRFGGVLWKTNH